MNNERKQVTERTTVFKGYYSSLKIEDLIHRLKHFRSQGYSQVRMIEVYEYSEKAPAIEALKYRKETNREYHQRIEQERLRKEARRLEYEKLRKEFEDT